MRPEERVPLRRRPDPLVHLEEDESIVTDCLQHRHVLNGVLPLCPHVRTEKVVAELAGRYARHLMDGLERVHHHAVHHLLTFVHFHLALLGKHLPHALLGPHRNFGILELFRRDPVDDGAEGVGGVTGYNLLLDSYEVAQLLLLLQLLLQAVQGGLYRVEEFVLANLRRILMIY